MAVSTTASGQTSAAGVGFGSGPRLVDDRADEVTQDQDGHDDQHDGQRDRADQPWDRRPTPGGRRHWRVRDGAGTTRRTGHTRLVGGGVRGSAVVAADQVRPSQKRNRPGWPPGSGYQPGALTPTSLETEAVRPERPCVYGCGWSARFRTARRYPCQGRPDMFCEHCGAPRSAGAKFCGRCGRPFREAASTDSGWPGRAVGADPTDTPTGSDASAARSAPVRSRRVSRRQPSSPCSVTGRIRRGDSAVAVHGRG